MSILARTRRLWADTVAAAESAGAVMVVSGVDPPPVDDGIVVAVEVVSDVPDAGGAVAMAVRVVAAARIASVSDLVPLVESVHGTLAERYGPALALVSVRASDVLTCEWRVMVGVDV